MKTIHKINFEIIDVQLINFPECKFLHTGFDPKGIPAIWYETDTNAERKEDILLFVVGTGNPMPRDANHYLGSFNDGPFVWHIYTNLVF